MENVKKYGFIELLHQINNISNYRVNVFYRGESKKFTSPIRSKIGRHWELFKDTFGVEFKTDKEILNIEKAKRSLEIHEKNLFNHFKHFGSPELVNLGVNLSDDWEVLAIARHYGLDTRFIDFTRNPLVALFFAVNDDLQEDGYFYCLVETQNNKFPLLTHNMKSADKFSSPFELEEKWVIYQPSTISERIRAQNGYFVVQSDPKIEFQDNNLNTFIIDKEEKTDILNQLDIMGINEMTLFPGLGGVSSHLNNEIINQIKFGKRFIRINVNIRDDSE